MVKVGNEWPINGINQTDSALDVDRANPGHAKTNKVLSDADFRSQYWTSLYWAFTTLTTVGFGDITPATNGEKMYTMVVMVLGAVIYATIFGNVALVIQSLDHSYSRARARTEVVKNDGSHGARGRYQRALSATQKNALLRPSERPSPETARAAHRRTLRMLRRRPRQGAAARPARPAVATRARVRSRWR